jgi:hypothetical protein
VIHRVHRSDVGQQRLSSADVRHGLGAANVLLARLQSKAVRWLALGVLSEPNDAARKASSKRVDRGHESGVRSTVSKRNLLLLLLVVVVVVVVVSGSAVVAVFWGWER